MSFPVSIHRILISAGLLLWTAAAWASPSVSQVITPTGGAAAPGDLLQIIGAGFGSAPGEVWLDRGGYGEEAVVLGWDVGGGLIQARVPLFTDPGSVRLMVRVNGDESLPYPLLLAGGPWASAPDPSAVQTLDLSLPAATLPYSSATIPVDVSSGSGSTTPAAPPAISAVSVPGGAATASGIAGAKVTITGTHLGTRGIVTINGAAAVTTTWTQTIIVATLPNAPGTGAITVERDPGQPDDATATGPSFTILPPPTISGYTRAGLPVARIRPSEVVTIHGTNLGTSGQVMFYAIPAPVLSWTPQAITITVPGTMGSGPLVVVLNPNTGAEVRVTGPVVNIVIGN